jgi:hypothetical protein
MSVKNFVASTTRRTVLAGAAGAASSVLCSATQAQQAGRGPFTVDSSLPKFDRMPAG